MNINVVRQGNDMVIKFADETIKIGVYYDAKMRKWIVDEDWTLPLTFDNKKDALVEANAKAKFYMLMLMDITTENELTSFIRKWLYDVPSSNLLYVKPSQDEKSQDLELAISNTKVHIYKSLSGWMVRTEEPVLKSDGSIGMKMSPFNHTYTDRDSAVLAVWRTLDDREQVTLLRSFTEYDLHYMPIEIKTLVTIDEQAQRTLTNLSFGNIV